MEETIEVEVDDLLVDVSKEDWENDPEGVIRDVREKRAALRLAPLADDDRDPDYNELYPEEADQ